MGTYSSNVSLKVNAAISNAVTSGTLYTAPATGYAIVNLFITSTSGNATIRVGGRDVLQAYNPGSEHISSNAPVDNGSPGVSGISAQGIMVGPSQAVTVVGTGTFQISGVEFINTP